MANASGPKWRRQQPYKTESDIFDDDDNDDEAPESPAAARALRMLNPKPRPEAPKIKPSTQPSPGRAAATPATSTPLASPSAPQDLDSRSLHPHEIPLNSALARLQLRIRQNHYASAGGSRDWEGDVAEFQRLASSAYGQRALGWCEIARFTIEEERASQAGSVLRKDVEIGELRGQVGRLRGECEGLEGEVGKLMREVAELKGWGGGFDRSR